MRDEAARVEPCLRRCSPSAAYPSCDLVLDDGSTDGTADLVRAVGRRPGHAADRRAAAAGLARQAARLPAARRRGRPTPTCWSSSTPTWCSRPDAVAAAVAAAARGGRPALAVPADRGAAPAERLVQPLLQWSWLTFLPLRAMERSPRPSLAAAGGQLLVVRRAAYDRAGGHAAVRAEVLEDIDAGARGEAGRRPGRARRRLRLATCRMYTSGRSSRRLHASRCGRRSARRPARRPSWSLLLALYVALPRRRRLPSPAQLVAWSLLPDTCWGWPDGWSAPRATGGRAWPDALAHPVSVRACSRWLVAPVVPAARPAHREGTPTWRGRQRREPVIVSAPAWAVWPPRPGSPPRAPGHRLEQADVVGGKLGRLRQPGRHVPVRHRAEPADDAAGLRGAVRATGDLPGWTWTRWTRWSGTGSPTARRWTPAPDPTACRPDRRRVRRRRRPRTGGGCGARAEQIWEASGGPSWSAGRRPAPTWPAGGRLGDLPRSRPGGRCAGWAGATCLTRGCGCCWSGTRRTPAPIRAGRRPRWARSRTWSGASAAGICAAAWAPSPTRWSPGAPRSASPIRTRHRRDPDRGRAAAGPPGSGSADGRPVPADVVVANADAAARLPRPAAAAAPRGRLAEPQPRPGSCCCSASAADPAAGAPQRALPARTTTTSSTRSSAARPPGRCADPTIYVTRADDPAVRPDGARGVVRAGQRAAARTAGRFDWRRARRRRRLRRAGPRRARRAGVDVRDRLLFREADPGGPGDGDPLPRRRDLRHAPAGLLRPRQPRPGPGLFLVGGSVHPGGGLPLVMLSAKIVADRIGPAA